MFGHDVSPRLDWLYRDNPHGAALTWLALERGGDAVGVTSVFPRRVLVDGRPRQGAIGGDCYILPRARRRGLATLLHQATLGEMRAGGVDFMYGPPRANNLGALLKAGSREVTRFRRFTRPLTGAAVARAALSRLPTAAARLGAKLPLAALAAAPLRLYERARRADAAGVALAPVDRFGEEFDRLLARALPAHAILASRDRAFLAWRYLAAPARRQRVLALRRGDDLCGLVAVEREGEQAVIVDLLCADEPGLVDAALQLALERARAKGCAALELSCTDGSPLVPHLGARGFVGREAHGFQVALGDPGDPDAAALGAEAGWHFTDGDKDSDTVFSPEPD